jgi:hypothetical protein
MYPAYQVGGSNVTIEVIHRTLLAYINGDRSLGRQAQKLPPTFYLQLDNTVKYMFLKSKCKLEMFISPSNRPHLCVVQRMQKSLHFCVSKKLGGLWCLHEGLFKFLASWPYTL